jgi:hypothetical protein
MGGYLVDQGCVDFDRLEVRVALQLPCSVSSHGCHPRLRACAVPTRVCAATCVLRAAQVFTSFMGTLETETFREREREARKFERRNGGRGRAYVP